MCSSPTLLWPSVVVLVVGLGVGMVVGTVVALVRLEVWFQALGVAGWVPGLRLVPPPEAGTGQHDITRYSECEGTMIRKFTGGSNSNVVYFIYQILRCEQKVNLR